MTQLAVPPRALGGPSLDCVPLAPGPQERNVKVMRRETLGGYPSVNRVGSISLELLERLLSLAVFRHCEFPLPVDDKNHI